MSISFVDLVVAIVVAEIVVKALEFAAKGLFDMVVRFREGR